jgi:ApaG protein
MTQDYTAVTRGIRVSIRSFYLADQSEPQEGRFVWAYRVRIENGGAETVRLDRRTWRITDAAGWTQTVSGDGVVGQTPILAPGAMFEYTSGTPLSTPSGIMRGAYHMTAIASGETFDVEIPAFSLDSPHEHTRLN